MVTNSVRKRNSMQLIGRSKHALKVPCFFFPLKIWGESREGCFFSFFPHSQCVPTMFPSSSQCIPIQFPMYSSTCFPQHLTFIGRPHGRNHTLLLYWLIAKKKTLNLQAPHLINRSGEQDMKSNWFLVSTLKSHGIHYSLTFDNIYLINITRT